MSTLINIFVFVFVVYKGVFSQKCDDCIKYDLCPNALNRIQSKISNEHKQLFLDAHCGFDYQGETRVPKVCCSAFSTENNTVTPEDKRMDDHTNLKLLPTDCGVIRASRLIGSNIAELNEFPWIALISLRTRYGFQFDCTGSIINKRYVLTAARCVKDQSIGGVRVGEYDLVNYRDCQMDACESHVQDILVEMAIVHENYQGLLSEVNDIALIRLADDIDFSYNNVGKVCLPITSELRRRATSIKTAQIIGWGLTNLNTSFSVLHKDVIGIRNCNETRDRFAKPGESNMTNKWLCAESRNHMDDVGGPLILEEKYNNVYRYVQYGILSRSSVYPDNPSIYTDVTKFMGWILDNISP